MKHKATLCHVVLMLLFGGQGLKPHPKAIAAEGGGIIVEAGELIAEQIVAAMHVEFARAILILGVAYTCLHPLQYCKVNVRLYLY